MSTLHRWFITCLVSVLSFQYEGRGDGLQPFQYAVYSYYPDFNYQITLKVQNILTQDKEIEFDDTLLRSETRGVSFSLTYKREF